MPLSAYQSFAKTTNTSRLPFFASDIGSSTVQIRQMSKDIILRDFVSQFKKVNQAASQVQNLSKEQIKTLLKQWNSTSPESFGEQYSGELAKYTNEYLSGAGLMQEIESFLQTKDYTNLENSDKAASRAQKALEIINNRLGNYKSILEGIAESGPNANLDPITLEKIISLYNQSGNPVNAPEFQGQTLILPSSVQTENSNKVQTALSNLEQIISVLQSIAGGGKGALTGVGKDNRTITNPTEILRLAVSAFNNIGSEGIHEPLAAHIANVVKLKGNTEVIDVVDKMFRSVSGFSVHGESYMTANLGAKGTKMAGAQLKPDIELRWDLGSFQIIFPTSNKLRQSKRNFNKTTGSTFGNLHPQGITLGELLGMTLTSSPKWFEAGWSAILNAPMGRHTYQIDNEQGFFLPYEAKWQEFKHNAKYIALYRALIGTGITGDFAALLIVNDKVFSMYDILEQVENPAVVRWSLSHSQIPSFNELRQEISGEFTDNIPKDASSRISSQTSAIEQIYNKKYYIEIQLRALQGK